MGADERTEKVNSATAEECGGTFSAVQAEGLNDRYGGASATRTVMIPADADDAFRIDNSTTFPIDANGTRWAVWATTALVRRQTTARIERDVTEIP
jgi:hypothetical protein